MIKNKIVSKEDKRIFQGTFPVETTSLNLATTAKAGDVIGVNSSKKFGKYDGSTYTDVYGVAYEAIEEPGQAVVILTGGLVKDYIDFNEKEEELTIALRKIGIFIK